MKRIVLFVEGEGESAAVPKLVRKLLTEKNAWDAVILDDNPFRVGEVTRLLKDNFLEWKRKLSACQKRQELGGVLLLLDGDLHKVGGKTFCAASVARSLAIESKPVGGGVTFSVAVVFARQEYESWLIAGLEAMMGQNLPDGRRVAPNITLPDGDLEEHPRDAKGWLRGAIDGGYKPARDQSALTDLLSLDAVRSRGLRSFLRLDTAVEQLVSAIRHGQHIASPSRD
jgi:hypothetical protein